MTESEKYHKLLAFVKESAFIKTDAELLYMIGRNPEEQKLAIYCKEKAEKLLKEIGEL